MLKKINYIMSLSRRYIPALILMALFSIFAYLNVEQLIKPIKDDAKTINISGRQRMLSQNLALLGLEYAKNPNEKTKSNIQEKIELMRNSHNYLVNNIKSDKLSTIYNEKKLSLKLDTFLTKFDSFINNSSKELIAELASDAQVLLPLLAEAVAEYENINNLKIKHLEQRQLYILIATFILLLLEAMFVFYPASQNIKKNTDELEQLNNILDEKVKIEVAKNREKDRQLIEQSRLAGMGEMIGNIAHQWRQPLNALSLVIGNIKDAYDFGKLDDARLNKAVEKSNMLIQKMSSTIDDFRDFFKPQKEKKEFSIEETVEDTINLLEGSFKHSNIKIEKEFAQNSTINGFKNEFSQVVLNILNNAKDALVENNIENPLIKIKTSHENGSTCLTIEDNGGGIPDTVIDKIFEPYFTTKEQGKGTGIGLHMSKMIIENHMNGKISVKNGENGAVMTIKINLTDGEKL